jgi:hypothetical protein
MAAYSAAQMPDYDFVHGASGWYHFFACPSCSMRERSGSRTGQGIANAAPEHEKRRLVARQTLSEAGR